MWFYRPHTYPHKGENVTPTESHKPVKAGTGQRADNNGNSGFIGRISGRSAGDTKAKRELLEKFDIAEAELFRGGLTSYKEHSFTSIVEHLAEKRLEAQERYQKHLKEIEEMHKKRVERHRAM